MKIAKNLYWLGHELENTSLQCNPYLLCDGEEWVLFDPGSPLDFAYVLENVKKHVPVDKVNYIVLSHQDPDLCASVPLFEEEGFRGKIALHWRTSVIVHYYGITSQYYLVDEMNYQLVLKSGRILQFIHTPFLHFPGAMITYDKQTKVLFTGDLFGSFSNKWQLFANDQYMESMKTFHEHYMPGNDHIKPIMKKLLNMDISLIAPQHGSVIKEKVKTYIKVLRDLECGSLNNMEKKHLQNVSYQELCDQVLERYYATFHSKEIVNVFNNTDIILNRKTLLIEDFSCTGEALWDQFFEYIYTKKGQAWLNVVEILVQHICNDYDIEMPSIYRSTLYSYQKKVETMTSEVAKLSEINSRLETNLQKTKDSLFSCPITKLYNGFFFKNYLPKEIQHALDNDEDFSIFFLEIDEFGQRISDIDREAGDEILRNCAYLFDLLKMDSHLLFKLNGATFVFYLPTIVKEEGVKLADHIRIELKKSDYFLSSITASIGIASLSEISTPQKNLDEMFNGICNMARMRLTIAKRLGMDMVYSESDLFEAEKSSLGTILIADSDPLNTDIIKTLVEQIGYDTISCQDGETALSLIYTNTPVLVISEEVLPKMDGFQIREKMLLSSVLQTIPFILMGYNKDDASVNRAYNISISHFLKKPYMPSELLGIIKSQIKEKE